MAEKTLFQIYAEGNGLYSTQRGYGHDLTGKIFGLLTVNNFHGKIGRRLFWECLCRCGRVKIAPADDLRRKSTWHCGDISHSKYRQRENIVKRLLSYVEKTNGCWLWRGAIQKDTGYGSITILGKTWRAHRAVYTYLVGDIPRGIDLLHSCDTPACVCPDHLRPGDDAQNQKDRKDRDRIGFELSTADVKFIKSVLSERRPRGVNLILSCRFGVSMQTISDIKY